MHPRIKSVKALDNYLLLITFDNNVIKKYNCKEKFKDPLFSILKNKVFFKSIKVDPGGYGVSWNDELDLSEYELWTRGQAT
ncbi:MAG: DUF2442 domain-containing protein [Candidatus Cloacimonetes bacterium]|nr:DUF2442 domain-containing protein [Candidatus Cloacimonadota bacterium]MBL7086089.1 DUF2442 domain-containing protein [Candidatus Cloacimonadota bacterium]